MDLLGIEPRFRHQRFGRQAVSTSQARPPLYQATWYDGAMPTRERVPYAPPLPPRGAKTVEAGELLDGDWIDDAPYFGRIIGVSPTSDGSEVTLTLQEAGSTRLTIIERVHAQSHWTVVPDPGAEPHEVTNPNGFRR